MLEVRQLYKNKCFDNQPLILTQIYIPADKGSITESIQEVLTPLWKIMADGCHLNRDPQRALTQIFGSANVDVHKFAVPYPPIVDTVIYGVATKNPKV
jgi:hypothetical protein